TRQGERAGHRDGSIRNLSAHCAPILSQRPDRGGPLSRGATGQSTFSEAVATVRSPGAQEPGLAQFDASPSLAFKRYSEGAPASVPGPRTGLAGVLFCQTAAQWLFGFEDPKAQAGPEDVAQVPAAHRPVRTKPSPCFGGNTAIVARTHCAHVALFQ